MSVRTFAIAVMLVASATGAFGEEFSDERAAIGKKNGVVYRLGAIEPDAKPAASTRSPDAAPPADPAEADEAPSGIAGVYSALSVMLFGKDRSVLEARAAVTDALEGESDFYWGGFKVWNSKPEWRDGAYRYAAGLPTLSMRAPLVRVPVGPVTLAVDAGVAAEANLAAKLAPLISIPIQFTSLKATLEAEVAASGFIEGYVKWLILRAGVGGELRLVRADAKLSGQVGFGRIPPRFAFEGYLSLLAGKIYGFVDYFNLFRFKWKRALEPVFADWKGKCVAFSKTAGGADPCAVSVP